MAAPIPNLVEDLQSDVWYTAPAGGWHTLDDPGGDPQFDIDIPPNARFCRVDVRPMENTRHRLRHGDKLFYSETGWGLAGAYIAVFKAAPQAQNYMFGPHHGANPRSNMRAVGYMTRATYRTLCDMIPAAADNEGRRPGHVSGSRLVMYFGGRWDHHLETMNDVDPAQQARPWDIYSCVVHTT